MRYFAKEDISIDNTKKKKHSRLLDIREVQTTTKITPHSLEWVNWIQTQMLINGKIKRFCYSYNGILLSSESE